MNRTAVERDEQTISAQQKRKRRSNSPSNTRTTPVESLHRTVGNRGIQKLHEGGKLQSTLEVSEPDDRHEREADRVADAVLRTPNPSGPGRLTSSRASTDEHIQRMCPRCRDRYRKGKPLNCPECERELPEGTVQRDTSSTVSGRADGPVASEIQSVRNGGRPLPDRVRSFFEPRFDRDFGDVRIHTGGRADRVARSVNAKAFTVGSDIVFRRGAYQLYSTEGKRLLAHELTHVVQQTGTRGFVQRKIDDLVEYTGGSSGNLRVFENGSETKSVSAISGHPGSAQHEVGAGPIPDGTYGLHPQWTQSPVTGVENGTCGAKPIFAGYQKIQSTDTVPCNQPSHYCTVSCPQSPHGCYTPQSCWGPERIRIEGKQTVSVPGGGTVTRTGFYIHGGDHSVTVSSGCIKVTDYSVFDEIRKLKGEVPMCVGSACSNLRGSGGSGSSGGSTP